MPSCSLCGRQIDSDDSICGACLDEGERASLTKLGAELTMAREKYQKALAELDSTTAILQDLPPGHPDGTASLHVANLTLKEATQRLNKALGSYYAHLRVERSTPPS